MEKELSKVECIDHLSDIELRLIHLICVFLSAELLEQSKIKFVEPKDNGTMFYLSESEMSFII